MTILRRANERFHELSREAETWNTFHQAERMPEGFGTLASLSEERIGPGCALELGEEEREVLVYLRDGILAHAEETGRAGIIESGDFLRAATGPGRRHYEINPSQERWAHLFRISLRPLQGEEPRAHEQKRFCTGDRRGRECVVASRDGRSGSLRIRQDALLFSTILETGQHLVHALAPGRCVWLHIVDGEVTLNDTALRTGDGVGIITARAVSVTARASTELLILDMSPSIKMKVRSFNSIERARDELV